MEKKNKNEKHINIYEVAGKAGKVVRKYGGYLVVAGTFIITKGPVIIKKIKK